MSLLKRPLPKDEPIAFICSFCLGDNLISLVTINNLIQNGYQVDVYGDYAFQLREWFPNFNIFPQVSLHEQTLLKKYHSVLHMYESDLSKQMIWHPHSVTLSHSPLYLADMTMVDIQVHLCAQELRLKKCDRINNIVPLPGLIHRKFLNRIIMHPTSSLARKNWPAKKFLKLAHLLQTQGFQIDFIVSKAERSDWEWVQQENIGLPTFSSLSNVASWVFESGYFIGNDSGIGHLSSNLNIPTVSIILRKGVAKQWRPTWSSGKVVLSPAWLNPRPIKEKLWKKFTRVSHVKKAFEELLVNT